MLKVRALIFANNRKGYWYEECRRGTVVGGKMRVGLRPISNFDTDGLIAKIWISIYIMIWNFETTAKKFLQLLINCFEMFILLSFAWNTSILTTYTFVSKSLKILKYGGAKIHDSDM